MAMSERVFLVGSNETKTDCGMAECPAVAARSHPGIHSNVLPVAKEYDRILRNWARQGRIEVVEELLSTVEFIATEEDAKAAWILAVKRTPPGKSRDIGEEIAKELGWV